MEEIHGDRNMEGIQDECAKELLSSCHSDMISVIGDSQVVPRVGPEYQVEIPPLVEECCHVELVPGGSEVKENIESSLLGLPIPLMWSRVEVQTAEPLSIPSLHKEVLSVYKLVCGMESTSINSVQKSINKIDQAEGVLCPLPDSLSVSWEDAECDSFLLALYVFGKNLAAVKRFVGSKEMEDILSFYYGQFYGSKRYRRWADCRKLRGRRHVSGPKIFSGWRQQELLSRLFDQVSPECQGIVAEAAREYGEGKINLEEYALALKSVIGVGMLVQAVGIGKGKLDLTSTSMEQTKSSNSTATRPEMPIGKACSSLTCAEIIKFLTGGFRLSKARSSDLFWEAVWPRLLAGGWHSEQPKDIIYSSKNSLVFLVPGVKKFSRRKLVKGNHYFDSVSDVLNKVASEPGLLELDIEGVDGNGEKENCGSDFELKRKKDHSSDVLQLPYLQPPHINSNGHVQQFMIIDTSVARGAERPKVRELRSLPVGTFGASASSSISSGSAEDTSDESQGKGEINAENRAYVEEPAITGPCLPSTDMVINHSDESIPNASDFFAGVVCNRKSKSTSLFVKQQPRKAMKYQPSRKAKPGYLKCMVPCTKPRSFASGYDANSTCITEDVSTERKLYEDDSQCASTSPSAWKDIVMEPPLDLSPNLIDLKMPDVSADSGDNRPIIDETSQKNDARGIDLSLYVCETSQKPEPLKPPVAIPSAELQSSTNSRRQSTRNRPLTMKALEALELGYFDSVKKRKSEDIPECKSKKKSARQIQRNVGVKENHKHGSRKGSENSRMGAYPNGLCNNSDVIGESQV